MSISIVSSSLEVRSFCRDLDSSIHTIREQKKTAEVVQSGGMSVPTVILAHNRRMRALLLRCATDSVVGGSYPSLSLKDGFLQFAPSDITGITIGAGMGQTDRYIYFRFLNGADREIEVRECAQDLDRFDLKFRRIAGN
jgi:hypothetical protein